MIIANRHHWDRRWPDYPGAFAGEIIRVFGTAQERRAC